MENYPAVNIFCELWPFGTYDPDKCYVNVGANGWYVPLLVYLVIKAKGKWSRLIQLNWFETDIKNLKY